jgi:hypothetical protein
MNMQFSITAERPIQRPRNQRGHPMTYAISTAAEPRLSDAEIPAVGAASGGVRAVLRAEGLALAATATAAYGPGLWTQIFRRLRRH